jgi:hypothetical protein
MASRNARCVVPSFTIAPQRRLGWSKVLTMKMNEVMANVRKPAALRGATVLSFPRGGHYTKAL